MAKGMCQRHYTAAWRRDTGYSVTRKKSDAEYQKKRLAKMSPKQRKEARAKHAAEEKARRKRYRDVMHDVEWERQRYLRNYGMTKDDYARLLEKQGGVCAICRRTPSSSVRKRLAVDHNHTTGKVRGLLCEPCNHGIGKLGDDPVRCRAAAAYLECFSKG